MPGGCKIRTTFLLIPSSTTRTDPDGHDAAWYFQKAYDVSVEAIDNPGPFGLENTFYDVHVGGNDRNKEMLLYADHTQESEFYNGSPLTGFQSELGGGRNSAVWMVTWNYTVIRSAPNSNGTGSGVSSVQREAAQGLGRPYTRMAPPIGVFTNTFAEKTLDSVTMVHLILFSGATGLKAEPQMQRFITLMICRLLRVIPYSASSNMIRRLLV